MTSTSETSWIFLAIAIASKKTPANYREISEIADGINHAVPTQEEMQNSIKWLIQHDLIIKTNKRYSLSNIGVKLYEKSSLKTNTILIIWEKLESELSKFV